MYIWRACKDKPLVFFYPVSHETAFRLITPNSLIAYNVNNNENRQGSPVTRPIQLKGVDRFNANRTHCRAFYEAIGAFWKTPLPCFLLLFIFPRPAATTFWNTSFNGGFLLLLLDRLNRRLFFPRPANLAGNFRRLRHCLWAGLYLPVPEHFLGSRVEYVSINPRAICAFA